jgi:hypothetical protein
MVSKLNEGVVSSDKKLNREEFGIFASQREESDLTEIEEVGFSSANQSRAIWDLWLDWFW